eukprot:5343784-Amphidinium_carterae.1
MPDGDERDPLARALALLSVRGQHWRLRPIDAVEPDYSEELPKQWVAPQPTGERPDTMPPIGPLGPRRVHVRKAVEVKRYNATPGSKGCIENGRNYTEECRVRMEQLMSEDADLKTRVLEADAKRAKRSTTETEGTGTEGQREKASCR